jgi:hyperosmotically inducible periplasmic protein
MRFAKIASVIALCAALSAPTVMFGRQQADRAAHAEGAVSREVRHELMMLPRYTVFDILQYSVNGGHVTLTGAVTQPYLKSDAEAAVKKVEGVESIDNQIEVLPVSPNDDQTRRVVYRTLYSQPGLERYSEGALQSIHIIVKNGNVTLVGTVGSQADKDEANIVTRSVPNIFSVTNNLTVEKSS